jgi:hypothetical protein
MFDFTLHAGTRCYFLFHKHVLVIFLFYCFQHKNKIIKIEGEDAEFFFFLAYQILHIFLPNISVHCTLIDCAFI